MLAVLWHGKGTGNLMGDLPGLFNGKSPRPDEDDKARAILDQCRRDRLERQEQELRAKQAGAEKPKR